MERDDLMPKLEVFFDYACPYCYRGHKNLMELLPDFPEIEALWRPCEAHPRPDWYGTHSDLCIQGMFFAMDQKTDLLSYHERMYDLIHNQHVNVENISVLVANTADLLEIGAFREALVSENYRQIQQEANVYAFNQNSVRVVPAYRMDGRRLDSVEDIGVTKAQLRAFLNIAR